MIDYIDHMGSDLTVVNAARVSFGKWKEVLDKDDKRLIKYLIQHKHMSPFRHCSMSVRVTCPIFVERQWFKHQVGATANSISGRYVSYDLGYWQPMIFRKGTSNLKQGSLDEPVDQQDEVQAEYQKLMDTVFEGYLKLIYHYGVCREQARTVLPLATNTQFIYTASLQAWHNFYIQRSDPHAQKEIREYTYKIDELLSDLFPVSWQYLKEGYFD